jgi:hypothetical protein
MNTEVGIWALKLQPLHLDGNLFHVVYALDNLNFYFQIRVRFFSTFPFNWNISSLVSSKEVLRVFLKKKKL